VHRVAVVSLQAQLHQRAKRIQHALWTRIESFFGFFVVVHEDNDEDNNARAVLHGPGIAADKLLAARCRSVRPVSRERVRTARQACMLQCMY
jgi:hypothetical protein